MEFNAVTYEDISFFGRIIGEQYVLTDQSVRSDYGHDYTEDLLFVPELVLKPGSAEEISAILKYCNEKRIPATARGAGTGLSGGALPVSGGIVLSTERLNKILSIDEENFQATVEPGVINEAFQNAVKEKGLFYPPDPASKGSCSLGGNIAHGSGGPKAVKYGVTRDYVLNLEIVLPTGEIIWTGADVLKNSTGFNLTHLIIGSEGTLGIVTKIVFRLLSYPKHNLLMLVPFPDAEKACACVPKVFINGLIPSAMEFMERSAIEITLKHLNLNFNLHDGAEAYLLIEVDGNDLDKLMSDCEQIANLVESNGGMEVLFADSSDQKELFWKIRRSIGETVKSYSIYKEEDTVVKRANLPHLLKGVKEIGSRYGFESVCYGHAGDGNLHVNILKSGMSDDAWNNELPKAIREIFHLCKELGGTISGEHGIGYVQKNYLDIVFDPVHFSLMKGIKKLFDPSGILNPGKIFPD